MEHRRFPNRLKKFRRIFCFSQKEVAAMIGLRDTSSLSRWEKGVSFPHIKHLFQLARLYKAMPNELYFDLWQTISQEIVAKEKILLAHKESLINNNLLYL